jgi:hypothetical protein
MESEADDGETRQIKSEGGGWEEREAIEGDEEDHVPERRR